MFDNIQVTPVILEEHCALLPILIFFVAVFLLHLWTRANP